MRRLLVVCAVAACAAEAEPPGEAAPVDSTPAPAPTPAADEPGPAAASWVTPLGAERMRDYARRVAPMVAMRTLKREELAQIDAQGEKALPALVGAWVREPAFAEAARMMIALQLRASGKRETVDLNLPANLAAHLVRASRPWSEIVTADTCVDSAGKPVACDTGAPWAAGVLATRAFLMNNAGRLNLRRARTVMQTFACHDYPMPDSFQPRLAKNDLLPMFQADNADEQTVEAARGTFGNGHACYTCHSQFGAHAQVFVRFDETGKWKETATGLQDPKGERAAAPAGRSPRTSRSRPWPPARRRSGSGRRSSTCARRRWRSRRTRASCPARRAR